MRFLPLKIGLVVLGLAGIAHADPAGPPAGRPILNSDIYQRDSKVNIDTATVKAIFASSETVTKMFIIPIGSTIAVTCDETSERGKLLFVSSATTGAKLFICEGAAGWRVVGSSSTPVISIDTANIGYGLTGGLVGPVLTIALRTDVTSYAQIRSTLQDGGTVYLSSGSFNNLRLPTQNASQFLVLDVNKNVTTRLLNVVDLPPSSTYYVNNQVAVEQPGGFRISTGTTRLMTTSTMNVTGSLQIPHSSSATAADCAGDSDRGKIYIDTNASSGQQVYGCEGTAGWVLQGGSGGSGTPGGSDTQFQYNNAGSFAGADEMTTNGSTVTITKALVSTLTVTTDSRFQSVRVVTIQGLTTMTFPNDSKLVMSTAIFVAPNGATPKSTECDAENERGRIFVDTNATSGLQIYGCEGLSGWVLQGDGNSGGAGADNLGNHIATMTISALFGINASTISVSTLTVTNNLVMATGSVAGNPRFNFAGAATTGFTYDPVTSSWYFKVGGVAGFQLSSTLLQSTLPDIRFAEANSQEYQVTFVNDLSGAVPGDPKGHYLRFSETNDAVNYRSQFIGIRSSDTVNKVDPFFVIRGGDDSNQPTFREFITLNLSTFSTNSGNFGINIATPTSKLHVNGVSNLPIILSTSIQSQSAPTATKLDITSSGMNLYTNNILNTSFNKSTSGNGANTMGGTLSASTTSGDKNDQVVFNALSNPLVPGNQPYTAYGAGMADDSFIGSYKRIYWGLRSKPGEDDYFFVNYGTNTNCGTNCEYLHPASSTTFVINLTTDSVNYGAVGILISTPTAKLHVGGDAIFTSSVTVGGGTPITKVIGSTATTIDFPNTLATTCSDVPVTVVGALENDVCSVGAPSSVTATAEVFCFVSGADTVTTRFCTHGAIENPASATYRIMLTRFQ